MGRVSNITNTVNDLKLAFRVFDRIETAKEFMTTNELRYVLEYLAKHKLIENHEVNECLNYFDSNRNGVINFGIYFKIHIILTIF
jgi:hypothetical protein